MVVVMVVVVVAVPVVMRVKEGIDFIHKALVNQEPEGLLLFVMFDCTVQSVVEVLFDADFTLLMLQLVL